MVVHQVWDRDSLKGFSNGNETLVIFLFFPVFLRSPPFCVILRVAVDGSCSQQRCYKLKGHLWLSLAKLKRSPSGVKMEALTHEGLKL